MENARSYYRTGNENVISFNDGARIVTKNKDEIKEIVNQRILNLIEIEDKDTGVITIQGNHEILDKLYPLLLEGSVDHINCDKIFKTPTDSPKINFIKLPESYKQ
jgi:hypothetical protein